jgi:hypothetical protein
MKLSELIENLQKFKTSIDDHDPEVVMILDDCVLKPGNIFCNGATQITMERGKLGLVPEPTWEDEATWYLEEA